MTTVEELLGISALSPREPALWGRPFVYSSLFHAAALILILAFGVYRLAPPAAPIKILEIGVMGQEDLALKGAGDDFGRGPMPDKSIMAGAPKKGGKVVAGNTPQISRSLAAGKPPAQAAATLQPLAKLTALGPIFGSSQGRGGGIEPGVGREKIYLKAGASRLAAGRTDSGGGGGEGLVGASNGPIDLKSRRGAGGDGDGRGNFLGGGEGSVNGGSQLMRRGESIVVHYPTVSDGLLGRKAATMDLPPSSDDFFSIRGPLSRRKILSLRLPKYPRWAEDRGVEAQVSVWLSVTADGRVKSNLYIEQTSGYPALDQVALESIQKMQFAPLADPHSSREESGVATFNFKLRRT